MIVLATPSCVMPRERTFATVANTALVGAGITGAVWASQGGNEPLVRSLDSGHFFNQAVGSVSVGMIAAGVVGELITLAAHEGEVSSQRPAIARAALDCPTVLAVVGRTTETQRSQLALEPSIATCLPYAARMADDVPARDPATDADEEPPRPR
jgi:hypothetical protein